jgi:hypothetical protein
MVALIRRFAYLSSPDGENIGGTRAGDLFFFSNLAQGKPDSSSAIGDSGLLWCEMFSLGTLS